MDDALVFHRSSSRSRSSTTTCSRSSRWGWPPDRRDQGAGPRGGRRAVERRGPLLDPDLRDQLRGRRRHRHPDGVPVRHQLGAVLPLRGQRRSGRRSRWRACSRSSSSRRFLSLLVLGEKRLRRVGHFLAAVGAVRRQLALRLLHHRDERLHAAPGRPRGRRGRHARLVDFGAYLLNPWALVQYAHNMAAAVVTGSFVVAAVGAYYTLPGRHASARGSSCGSGSIAGLVASVLVAFPTGDRQAKMVAASPAGGARRDGGPLRERVRTPGSRSSASPTWRSAGSTIRSCSRGCCRFLAYGHLPCDGARASTRSRRRLARQHRAALLRLPHHGGLGTILIARCAGSAVLLAWRGRLERSRPMLWVLMLAFPFPYIANTAGWMTAELGRQPWLVYGLLRTAEGQSRPCTPGTVALHPHGLLRALPGARASSSRS